MNPGLNDTAAKAIARQLDTRGLSISQAAELIGESSWWLGRRLRNATELKLDDVELICEKLGIPISQILLPTSGEVS